MTMNRVKTVVLLGLMTGLLLGIGRLLGGMQGLTIAFIIAIGMNFVSYWFSDKIVLKIYRAQLVDENHKLSKITHEVAMLASIPAPKTYIIPSEHPNAFATGRNPEHAAVACTQGLMDLLDENELKGVIAHEISHIRNRDILISSIAATIAAVISYVAMMARWTAIFGGFGGSRDDNNSNIMEFLLLAIITPIIATLIQLAISRSREYLADEIGAKIIHDPYALADALEKLDKGIRNRPLKAMGTTESTAHMFISSPFRNHGLLNLFMTHPPMKKRVGKLRSMHTA